MIGQIPVVTRNLEVFVSKNIKLYYIMINSVLTHDWVNQSVKKNCNRRCKYIILFLCLLTLSLEVKSNPVDLKSAREIAAKFLNAKTEVPLCNACELHLETTYNTSRGDAAFYVFNLSHGFVIVAADDCARPILGYSMERPFETDNVPVQLQEYLNDFIEQIEYGVEHHLTADPSIAHQWQLVQATGRLNDNKSSKEVFPLLTTTWNQGCLYNVLCPEDPEGVCGHVWTGCTATAVAQIMRYWGYPIQGHGSHSYIPSGYPEQTVNFGATTYDWANMPNFLDESSDSTQINAVATLLWHCGVSTDMNYGIGGSGGAFPEFGIINYFGYSNDLFWAFRDDYDDLTWLTMVKTCLDLARPIFYAGSNDSSAHAFVCDGYDDDNLFHFNLGWGGSCDGYYPLDALCNGYSYDNYAYFNIHPACTIGTEFDIQASASPNEGGMVSGMGTFDCNTECTLMAIPSNGYRFVSWTENDSVVSRSASYVFPAIEDRDLVAVFEDLSNGILIGEGISGHWNMPINTCNEYSLTEQIYTSSDIGTFCGNITSIAFFNNTLLEETRNLSVFLINTDKNCFDYPYEWIIPAENDLYFSGNISFKGGDWTTIYFDKPFYYDATFNIAVMVDDNSGISAEQIYFLDYTADFSTIYSIKAWETGVNFNPFTPENYESSHDYSRNQVILGVNGYDNTETITIIPLAIYPNPSKSELYIEGTDIKQVEVFNTLGQLIETLESFGAEKLSLNVESYRPSIYLLKIHYGNDVTTRRFIKR